MSNTNPESKFVTKDLAAYEGLSVEEYTFCTLVNYHGEQQDYKLDVITRPAHGDTPRPVVIFAHGGGFVRPNDKRQGYIPVFAKALTLEGYAVVSPDYPVFDSNEHRATWNETRGADRAAEALFLTYQFVKENAARFGFDTDRIAVMGGSAGGMACYYLLDHYDVNVRVFGNCWGASRLPLNNVAKFPPTVSIHGTADQSVDYALELPIHEALDKARIPNKLITLEGAGHTPMKLFSTYISEVLAFMRTYMQA